MRRAAIEFSDNPLFAPKAVDFDQLPREFEHDVPLRALEFVLVEECRKALLEPAPGNTQRRTPRSERLP